MADFNKKTIEIQVARICASEAFATSPRLKQFLRYIVDETLEGRSDGIKGVTIATAVFGAGTDFDSDNNSIVRVEAGRLRQRLEQYYSVPGSQDPWVIEVPKGTYVPTFKAGQEHSESTLAGRSSRPLLLLAAFGAALFIAWGIWNITARTMEAPGDRGVAPTSGAGLSESQVLFNQAWVLLMPPDDPVRLSTSKNLFQAVMDSSPDDPAGYAGKAAAHAITVLFIKSDDPAVDLATGTDLARQSLALDQDYALAHAALGLCQSLAGEHPAALDSARRAIEGADKSGISNNLVGLILITAGQPELAEHVMLEAISLNPSESRTPFRNVLGLARFIDGKFESALSALEDNRSRNGPWGPHMDVVLAATHIQLGNEFRARAIVERMQKDHPDFPYRAWLSNYVHSDTRLNQLMDQLTSLGLGTP